MGTIEEIRKVYTLLNIGQGSDSQKKLMFDFELNDDEYKIIVNGLLGENLIKSENGKLVLTLEGLLTASNGTVRKEDAIRIMAKKGASFNYANKLGEDVIFVPYLSFDERENYSGENSLRLYKTELVLSNFSIQALQVVEDSLYNGSLASAHGGSWIIKEQSGVCGLGVRNMLETIRKHRLKNYSIKVAFSEHTYILIITARIKNSQIEKVYFDFYLSNCGETPYVDVLKQLNNTLRLFLNFVGVEHIPLGKEIIVNSNKTLINGKFYYGRLAFTPEICGKLYFKTKYLKSELPLIVAINPNRIRTDIELKRVFPWFVYCAGGFLEEDFKKKIKFQLHSFEQYNLKEATVVDMIVTPYVDSPMNRYLRKLHSKNRVLA